MIQKVKRRIHREMSLKLTNGSSSLNDVILNTSGFFTTVLQNTTGAPSDVPSKGSWKEWIQTHPDWKDVWTELRWMWQLHIYGMACLFLVLACAAFFTILSLRAQLSARPHLSSLNVFLCLLGGSRALGLFIDPYGSKQSIPPVMNSILWDLAFPCLLSAFSLLQLAFLQMTQVKVAPSRLNSETCVSLVITSHFCLTIASDILWILRNALTIVWLLTQVIFAMWGIFLCLTFLCGCLRLLRSIAKLPLVFLSQVDSAGYENKGVLPLGMFARRTLTPVNGRLEEGHGSNALAPKIKITDENEQTFSYVSDTSQHNLTDGKSGLSSIPGSPSIRRYQKNSSSKSPQDIIRHHGNWHKRKANMAAHVNGASTSEAASKIEDSFQPLMPRRGEGCDSVIVSQAQEEQMETASVISRTADGATKIKGNIFQQSIRLNGQAVSEEFRFDAHKLKPSRRSRVEKLLRKMVLTALLGLLLCFLHVYGVVGPHGLLSHWEKVPVIPWFCYQTIYRLVEFTMGCTMANITRQSLHNHCYHSCSSGIKHRDSLFT